MNFQPERRNANDCLEAPLPSNSQRRTVTLSLVDPATDAITAREFFRNKAACYSRFGSQAATNHSRLTEHNLRLVVARDAAGLQIGGIGIYTRGLSTPLPVESILGEDPRVADEIQSWSSEHSVAEHSGFWVTEAWRKSGLTRSILLYALAASKQLGISKVVGFSHNHVIDFYATVGYLPLANAPAFEYPHPPYVSMLVWADTLELSTLPEAAETELRTLVGRFAIGSTVACEQ